MMKNKLIVSRWVLKYCFPIRFVHNTITNIKIKREQVNNTNGIINSFDHKTNLHLPTKVSVRFTVKCMWTDSPIQFFAAQQSLAMVETFSIKLSMVGINVAMSLSSTCTRNIYLVSLQIPSYHQQCDHGYTSFCRTWIRQFQLRILFYSLNAYNSA